MFSNAHKQLTYVTQQIYVANQKYVNHNLYVTQQTHITEQSHVTQSTRTHHTFYTINLSLHYRHIQHSIQTYMP